MDQPRREATPVEVAALLMDAVCNPSPKEQDAVRELAALVSADAGRMQSELMFLRSFAVDLATNITLGETAERDAILERYYGHWARIDQEVEGVMADMQAHLDLYTQTVTSAEADPVGLQDQLGHVFAHCCGAGDEGRDLVMLGGAMFGAFYAEIADLLQEVDIALPHQTRDQE